MTGAAPRRIQRIGAAAIALLAGAVSVGCPRGPVGPDPAQGRSLVVAGGREACDPQCPAAPTGLVKIRRFWSDRDRDWVTAGSETTDEQLSSWGYRDRQLQFLAPASPGADTIAVYRWYSRSDGDWVTFRDGDPDDATITRWGYRDKTLSFHAYTAPGPGRVAVNRWWHEGDRDWVTIAEDEFPDATMQSWGYANKHFLFYARSAR
jgi:hypothetical protein